MEPRLDDAAHAVCYGCYGDQVRKVLERWPDTAVAPYVASNRYIRPIVPVPLRLLIDDHGLNPAALALYVELFLRGADGAWIAATIEELADAVGYSPRAMRLALQLLAPRYVHTRRGRRPYSVRAFRLAITTTQRGGAK